MLDPLFSLPSTSECAIVCGLGSLGQHCIAVLKGFGISTIGIDLERPHQWETPELPNALDGTVIGDCREPNVLTDAGIDFCRAVLIVTSDEGINIETALTARRLNPDVRIVVRSVQDNLNTLLEETLGNFIAFEPTQLTASSFALAAISDEILGWFDLEGIGIRIVRHVVGPEWCGYRLCDLNTQHRHVLSHQTISGELSEFGQLIGDRVLRSGDVLVYAELRDALHLSEVGLHEVDPNEISMHVRDRRPRRKRGRRRAKLRQWIGSFFAQERRVFGAIVAIVLSLIAIGTILFRYGLPTSWEAAFYTTVVLLLGGYSDLFGTTSPDASVLPLLRAFALMLTLMGTAFVGVLYARLTQALLSTKFQLVPKLTTLPDGDRAIIVGWGRVGEGVARLLRQLDVPMVGISRGTLPERSDYPLLPLIDLDYRRALDRAGLSQASSVLAVTNDDILNLEIALIARRYNPRTRIVIRTGKHRLGTDLLRLLPGAHVFCTYAVAAEAFAGAAFGEKIISLWRWYGETVTVTEYRIEDIDTLNGLLLSEITEGYGVIPILHQQDLKPDRLFPSPDSVMNVGDRLVVLATRAGLSRIENGDRSAPSCHVEVLGTQSTVAPFEGANAISRITGCTLTQTRILFEVLPAIVPITLYPDQARRLIEALDHIQVSARLVQAPQFDQDPIFLKRS